MANAITIRLERDFAGELLTALEKTLNNDDKNDFLECSEADTVAEFGETLKEKLSCEWE